MPSDGGKGDSLRPKEVSDQEFSDNWERTFGKKARVLVSENDYAEALPLEIPQKDLDSKCSKDVWRFLRQV